MSQTHTEPRRTSFHNDADDPPKAGVAARGRIDVETNDEPAVVGLFARAKDAVLNLPDTLRTNIQQRPVATLGTFTVLGVGVGVVFGNRVLRSVLITALGQTAIELGRDYVRRQSGARA